MTKQELKQMLESYRFDMQYLEEKIKELEKTKKQIELFLKSNTDKANSSEIYSVYIEKQNREQAIVKIALEGKKYVENAIQTLSQPFKTIVYLRYVGNLTFDEIAAKMNYSTKRIYQLHSEAMEKLLININSINSDQNNLKQINSSCLDTDFSNKIITSYSDQSYLNKTSPSYSDQNYIDKTNSSYIEANNYNSKIENSEKTIID